MQSRERAPMGGTPYMSAKERAGNSFECFCILPRKRGGGGALFMGFMPIKPG